MAVMSILASSTSMPAASSVVASILTLWETRAGKTKEEGLDELWGAASPTMLHGRRDWGKPGRARGRLQLGWLHGVVTMGTRHSGMRHDECLGRQEKNF